MAFTIISVAPFLGRLRDLLLERFPGNAVAVATATFGVLLAGAFLLAVTWIRRHRWLRYGGLVVCGLLVWLQLAGFATDIPEVDIVERTHILEYGLLSLLFYRAFLPLRGASAILLAILAAALVGVLDEWVQWFVASRVGEVGDVWLNASAAATGALFALCLMPPEADRVRPKPSEGEAIATLGAVTIVVFGMFYHCAHLGYEIRDRQAGWVFRSWFSDTRLEVVAAERARRWRLGRLPSLDPTAREDYFFVEGTSRVAYRNASLERGDFTSAWMEQRILERHYGPVLERRGLRSGEPLDLDERLREEVRRRAASIKMPTTYRSPVLANRIVIAPSKSVWWASIASVTTVLLALALGSRRRRAAAVA